MIHTEPVSLVAWMFLLLVEVLIFVAGFAMAVDSRTGCGKYYAFSALMTTVILVTFVQGLSGFREPDLSICPPQPKPPKVEKPICPIIPCVSATPKIPDPVENK